MLKLILTAPILWQSTVAGYSFNAPRSVTVVYQSETLSQLDAEQLRDYLNKEFSRRYANPQAPPVTFEAMGASGDKIIGSIANRGECIIGIMSAIRYVEAKRKVPELRLFGTIRKFVGDEAPSAEYESMIIIPDRVRERWPPSPGAGLRFLALRQQSASEYVFPREYFLKNGWIQNGAIVLTLGDFSEDTSLPLPLQHEGDLANNDAGDSLLSTLLESQTHDIVACGGDRYRETNKGFRDRTIAVSCESKIPNDAVVIRSPLGMEKGMEEEQRQLEMNLQLALLSTRVMSDFERSTYRLNGKGRNRFHDIVESSDAAYDGVRRAEAVAHGGRVLRLGISRAAHSQGDMSQDYYRKLRIEALLRGTLAERVFLELIEYGEFESQRLCDDLVAGRLDVAEVPGSYAAKAKIRKCGVVCSIKYLDESKTAPNTTRWDYYGVILTKTPHTLGADIDRNARFAITRMDSMSGYLAPIEALRKKGVSIPQENFHEMGSAHSVLRAVLVGEADYGFMADWELTRLRKQFALRLLLDGTDIAQVDDTEIWIPATVLMASPSITQTSEVTPTTLASSAFTITSLQVLFESIVSNAENTPFVNGTFRGYVVHQPHQGVIRKIEDKLMACGEILEPPKSGALYFWGVVTVLVVAGAIFLLTSVLEQRGRSAEERVNYVV